MLNNIKEIKQAIARCLGNSAKNIYVELDGKILRIYRVNSRNMLVLMNGETIIYTSNLKIWES